MNETSTASAPLVTREALVPRDEIPNEKLTWMDLMIDPFDTDDIRHSTKGFVAACLNDIFHPNHARADIIMELTMGRTQDENWMSAYRNAKSRPAKEGVVRLVPVFESRWADSFEIRNAPQPCIDLAGHVGDLFESRTVTDRMRTANPSIDDKGTIRINFVNDNQKARIRKLADAKTFLEDLNVLIKN
ncbi:hypothetical protein KJ359_009743 [Pestalotiopsis sp. 9143b]|nr:hypothetical protein KJ359_009743 [Pestalotiopsis sp. 9143b]